MKYLPLNPALFIKNRERFASALLPNAIAIFVSNDEIPSNGDALFSFKQNSDLFWLSGITQEDSMVILFPNHPDPKYREVLVLVRPNALKEKWDGKRLRAEEATAMSGISTIVWVDSIDALLQTWIHLADHIYLDSNENDRKASLVQTKEYRFIGDMKSRYPLHHYHRAAKIMKQLRAIKTPLEVEVLQQAIDITNRGFQRLLKFIKPGVFEYEVEAEIWHSFLSQRATGTAYNSIIASGDRARTLHYISNNQECKSGELLLMDFGAEYGGYCADLTRTVPVNGKFSKRQKQVYNACLHLHNYAKSLLKPGITINDYHKQVGEEANQVFIKIGLLSKSDLKNQTPESPFQIYVPLYFTPPWDRCA
jgi:Xaa-Pro aminopeptidase